ncbi:unnamed protein product [Ilex paraguariensis]|uniref:DUF1664 domain-containing protein n=1 Tax=Ilex paraguariensis TaxID=185542 RepID=A0ABC8RIV4_9AQUA
MALPLGKLTILVGAGIVGSVLVKEGRLSNVSDFFSGALKIVLKQVRQDNSTPSPSVKPRNDSLLAQVNSLRQELQLLASNRPVTIVTSSTAGAGKYGAIIVVVVVGYGYVWWKGWKLPDMMFATRRGLSEASTTIAKQLENVYSSISATKRHLSSRIDRVECNLDEFAEVTTGTKEEVTILGGEVNGISGNVQSVDHAVRTLETKINRIEGKQDFNIEAVKRLVVAVHSWGNTRAPESIQAPPSSSSRLVLELQPMTASSRTESLPPMSSPEPPSPSASNISRKAQRPLQSAVLASGLKELHVISDDNESSSTPEVSNGVRVVEDTSSGYLNSGLFGRKLPGLGASFIQRTCSAIQSFK